jgi:3'(2'), 5'-bisphosphate nucleotidase
MDPPPDGKPIVDDALLEKLSAEVAAAAATTRAASRVARIKPDQTPVTEADERSQALLLQAMARLLPGVAVVSEEMAIRPSQLGDVFVLIDPLDGTKEFVDGSGEYTINLAIIRGNEPVAGIVAVPAAGLIYRGRTGRGADRLGMSPEGGIQEPSAGQPIRVRPLPGDGAVAVVSRSFLDPASVALLDRLRVGKRVLCGSALKFCRVAEGAADIYPRLAPTHEWDVAAGHAVLAAAGGMVTRPDGGSLYYGNAASNFRIPGFLAWGDRSSALDLFPCANDAAQPDRVK